MRIQSVLLLGCVIVLGGCGAQTSSTSLGTSTPQPQSPTANAGGPYSGTAGSPVSFSGAGSSDPQGQALTYAWNFGDNASATGVSPTHAYASAGTYTVSLTVTDTSNLSATSTSKATIVAAPQPPVPSAGGPYAGTAGVAITFSGVGSSDPQGQTLTFAWNFGDGISTTGVSPTHTYVTAGTYAVSLTTTDTSNLSATATTKATIVAAPQPPIPSAGGPYAGTAGTAVAFNAAGSTDPQRQALSYVWSFGDGATAIGVSPTHTYATAGTYTVSLAATDTSNLSATATTNATIAAAPQPPVPSVGGPYSGTAGTAIKFSAAGSTDPQGQTLSYTWAFGDGATAMGVNPTHTYASAGTYTVTLTVTDTSNLNSTVITKATIAALQMPIVSIGGPYSGTAGTAISFSAAGSSDPQEQMLSYAWNFGDGSMGSGISPSHTYAAVGTYTVSLVVTDTSNLSMSAMARVTIAAAPQPPVAVVGGPYAGIAGLAFNFNGSASSDPQGQTLVYMWNFGDGTTGTGASPAHTYQTPGSYSVSLIVVDTSGLSATATTLANIVNQGTVYNGLNPLGGVKLYVLAANTTGYGQASKSLLTSSLIGTDSIGGYIRTQGNGGFTITGDYTCSAGDQVYLYVDGTEFSAGTYMGVLGACPATGNFSAALPNITVNQVTTVAAAYSLAGFAGDAVHISSSGSTRALAGIANSFTTAGSLASITSGSALPVLPTTIIPALVPQAEINSLANIIMNMSGDTATSAINIAHSPGSNVSDLFNLQSAKAPFQPALSIAPHDWTVKIFYYSEGYHPAFDSSGNFWSDLTKWSPTGQYIGFTHITLPAPPGDYGYNYAVALDPSDNVWIMSYYTSLDGGGPYALNKADLNGEPLTAASGITGNGMGSFVTSADILAVDGLGNAWVASTARSGNSSRNYVSKFLSDGSTAPNSPFANPEANGTNGSFPSIAIDPSENVWVANPTGINSTVTELTNSGDNAPGSPFESGVNGGFHSIAIDHNNSVWASKIGANAVYKYSVPPSFPGMLYPDGLSGSSGPDNLVFDGLGNLWGTDVSQSGVVGIDSSGNRITPAEGFGQVPPPAGLPNEPTNIFGSANPPALAIDGSGNLWVAGGVFFMCNGCDPSNEAYDGGLFEFVGLTAPVVTPLSYAVKTNTLATRP